MEELEKIAFEIISYVGTAKSMFMESLMMAEKGEFDKAYDLLKEGKVQLNKGHSPHMKLIQKEAIGEDFKINLLLVHAEDQMMTADMLKELTEKMIKIYKKIDNKVC